MYTGREREPEIITEYASIGLLPVSIIGIEPRMNATKIDEILISQTFFLSISALFARRTKGILFSWLIAFAEYCCQVPANRLGFEGNGGPFNLMQLKVIQEVISLIVFTVIATVLFQGQALHWNHLAAFICLILAVYFVFL